MGCAGIVLLASGVAVACGAQSPGNSDDSTVGESDVGVASGVASAHRPEDLGSYVAPPESLEPWLERLSAVVVGEYVEIVESVDLFPPGYEDKGLAGLPMVLMRFEVREYLVGGGPDTFIIGQYWDRDSGRTYGVPVPDVGQEITMAVTPWAHDPTILVALYGGYGRWIEVNGSVDYAFVTDVDRAGNSYYDSIPFAAGLLLRELEEAIRAGARERGFEVPSR